MQFRTTQLVQGVEGARGFISKYADALPRTAASGARQQLDELGEKFQSDAAAQMAKSQDHRGGVDRKEALRRALFREHLAPIVAAAKLLAVTTPGLKATRLPKDTLSIPRLVAAARGVADSTAPFTQKFAGLGLGADFGTRLREAAAALEAEMKSTRGHKGARVKATSSLYTSGKEAVALVRVLDRMVRADLGDNEPVLAEWESVRGTFNARSTPKDETKAEVGVVAAAA